MKEKIKKLDGHALLVSGIVILLMFTATACSPLYVTNQWDDTNVSFTIARAWIHGVIPYRDVFEQRGILFYCFYTMAALVSETDFLGLFLVEVLFALVAFFGLYKITNLVSHNRLNTYIAFLGTALIYGSSLFGYGGSPEELAAPCVIWFCYYVMKYFYLLENQTIPVSNLIIMGLLFSCVFWSKFSLAGMFVGFYLVYGVYLLFTQAKLFFKTAAYSLLGFFIPVVLPLTVLYFQKGLRAFFTVYFYNNIFLYSNKILWFSKIFLIIRCSGADILAHFVVSFLLLSSLCYLIFETRNHLSTMKPRSYLIVLLPVMVLFQFFSIYFSGQSQWYYYLGIVILIAPIVCVSLALVLVKLPNRFQFESNIPLVILLVMGIIQFGAGNQNMKNAIRIGDDLTPIATIDIGAYIKSHSRTKNPTLIEYNGIDSGFFLHSDAIPTEKYFEQTNFPLKSFPDSYYGQLNIIKQKAVQFVVIRSNEQRDFRNQLLIKRPYLFTNFSWLDESKAKHTAYVPTKLLLNYQLMRTSYTTIYGEKTTVMLFEARKKNLTSVKALMNEAE